MFPWDELEEPSNLGLKLISLKKERMLGWKKKRQNIGSKEKKVTKEQGNTQGKIKGVEKRSKGDVLVRQTREVK